jgi:ABC-type branched-subunit amino acid transport system substrate-binding protein
VTNTLHCANTAYTPTLSRKSNYPNSIRTQLVGLYQAQAALKLVSKFNMTQMAVMVRNDDLGSGFIQSLRTYAQDNGVTLNPIITYDDSSPTSIISSFQAFTDSGSQTLFLQIYGEGAGILQLAYKLNLLDGRYWIICPSGIDDRLLGFNLDRNVQASFHGLWQVDHPTPYDNSPEGTTKLAQDFRKWYRDLYNADSPDPSLRGVAKNYDSRWGSLFPTKSRFPNKCNPGPIKSLAQSMDTIFYTLVSFPQNHSFNRFLKINVIRL